jgi:hypothetical protein
MRIFLLAATGAIAVSFVAATEVARAFDNSQFCQATTQMAQAAARDVGTWLDRSTRNDGFEIICSRKLVHFKRHFSAPASALRGDWKDKKAEEWQRSTCAQPPWRDAVEGGWLISATVTTVTAERVWFACQPGGTGFYRVIP